MKNGKVRTLFMIVYGSLTGSWKSLFKEQKAFVALKTRLDLLLKAGLSVLASWDGTLTYKKKELVSKAYSRSLKLEKSLVKLKLKVKELVWPLLKLMVSLCGVLALVCVTLILGLLLPLFLIVSLAEMFRPE